MMQYAYYKIKTFHQTILVFNLSNKIDVDETERKIAEYKETNKDLIMRNRGKLVCAWENIDFSCLKLNFFCLIVE